MRLGFYSRLDYYLGAGAHGRYIYLYIGIYRFSLTRRRGLPTVSLATARKCRLLSFELLEVSGRGTAAPVVDGRLVVLDGLTASSLRVPTSPPPVSRAQEDTVARARKARQDARTALKNGDAGGAITAETATAEALDGSALLEKRMQRGRALLAAFKAKKKKGAAARPASSKPPGGTPVKVHQGGDGELRAKRGAKTSPARDGGPVHLE